MTHVPYVDSIGSIVYAMVSTWPNISHAVGVYEQMYDNTKQRTLNNY